MGSVHTKEVDSLRSRRETPNPHVARCALGSRGEQRPRLSLFLKKTYGEDLFFLKENVPQARTSDRCLTTYTFQGTSFRPPHFRNKSPEDNTLTELPAQRVKPSPGSATPALHSSTNPKSSPVCCGASASQSPGPGDTRSGHLPISCLQLGTSAHPDPQVQLGPPLCLTPSKCQYQEDWAITSHI